MLINFEDYSLLKNHQSTLKATSIDTHDEEHACYMTESLVNVIDFDEVKKDYAKDLCLSESPKSIDALLIDKQNKLVFVEFKNGYIDHVKQYGIRKKLYDSVIILTDILEKGISKLRNDMEFILVYNEEINKDNKAISGKETYVQSSASFDQLAKDLSTLGKTEYVCFGLNIFENYCFHKVHTYTRREFEQYIQENI